MSTTTYERILEEVQQLTPEEQQRLRNHLTHVIEGGERPQGRRRSSSYGVLAHLGTAPSAEEIDEARREAWASFPREDIP